MAEKQDATVTTQPAISTEEASKTDEVLSPVGDEKVKLPGANRKPEQNDATVHTETHETIEKPLDR